MKERKKKTKKEEDRYIAKQAGKIIAEFAPFVRRVMPGGHLELHNAKKCAIVLIEKIIKESKAYSGYDVEFDARDGKYWTQYDRIKYWRKIKKAIISHGS